MTWIFTYLNIVFWVWWGELPKHHQKHSVLITIDHLNHDLWAKLSFILCWETWKFCPLRIKSKTWLKRIFIWKQLSNTWISIPIFAQYVEAVNQYELCYHCSLLSSLRLSPPFCFPSLLSSSVPFPLLSPLPLPSPLFNPVPPYWFLSYSQVWFRSRLLKWRQGFSGLVLCQFIL